MKQISTVLLLFISILSACAPSETAIQTALAQTQSAKPTETELPTSTPALTETSAPTDTSRPEATATSAPSVDEVRQKLLAAVVSDLSNIEDVDSVTLTRFNEGALELEIKTVWASQDRQPDASWNIVRIFADVFSTFDKTNLERVAGGPFSILLTTYSVDTEYRYQSQTDWDTIQKLASKSMSYEEWIVASGAAFK